MAKKRNACSCLEQIDAKLATKNIRVVPSFSLTGGPSKCVIATEKVDVRKRTSAHLVATFCPICGVKYP